MKIIPVGGPKEGAAPQFSPLCTSLSSKAPTKVNVSLNNITQYSTLINLYIAQKVNLIVQEAHSPQCSLIKYIYHLVPCPLPYLISGDFPDDLFN